MVLYAKAFVRHGLAALVVILLIIGPAVSADEQPATKTLMVLGAAPVRSGNIESTRSQAVATGLQEAVSRVILSEMPLEMLLKNFPAVSGLIQKNTDMFIQEYKVLTEARSGQQYNVLIEATVLTSILEKELLSAGMMIGRKALPKILFVVAEKLHRDMPPVYWWGPVPVLMKGFAEREAIGAMKQKDFIVVDPEPSGNWKNTGIDFNKPDLANSEAMELGRGAQADVVIIGRSAVHLLPNVMSGNVKTYEGTVTARAVRVDTGEEIGTSTQKAVMAGADESVESRAALAKAGSQVGTELAFQIMNSWYKESSRPTLVEVIIQGSSNLLYFERFRQALLELQGVRGLQIKEIRPDETRLVVDFEGNGEKLAASLMLKSYGAFGIHITEIALKNLKVQLRPN